MDEFVRCSKILLACCLSGAGDGFRYGRGELMLKPPSAPRWRLSATRHDPQIEALMVELSGGGYDRGLP
jgi:hypothetical protein